MSRIVPHQSLFDQVKAVDKWQTRVLFVATLLALASITLTSKYVASITPSLDCIIDTVNGIASILSVIYIVLDVLNNYILFKAEKARRIDLIDHSFDTNFSGEKSIGYYNPGGINEGVYKLAVQGFENSLFTSNMAKKMTKRKWVYATIVFSIFIVSACCGNKEWVNSLIQIAAAGILVQESVKFQLFSNQIENIHADFKSLFSNLKGVPDKTKNEGEMMKNVVNYETTIAWGSMIMDDTKFFKDNDALSRKWEQFKQDYKI